MENCSGVDLLQHSNTLERACIDTRKGWLVRRKSGVVWPTARCSIRPSLLDTSGC